MLYAARLRHCTNVQSGAVIFSDSHGIILIRGNVYVRMFCYFNLWENNFDVAAFAQELDLVSTSLPIHFTVFLCGGAQFLQYL